tara:strand:- start:29 stop:583 length:555 start_codon:yes stop_codon:yes gene_type:complete
MKKLLPLLLLILIGCSESELPEKEYEYYIYYEPHFFEPDSSKLDEGVIYYEINPNFDGQTLRLYNGTDVRYDENGELIEKLVIKNGRRDGEQFVKDHDLVNNEIYFSNEIFKNGVSMESFVFMINDTLELKSLTKRDSVTNELESLTRTIYFTSLAQRDSVTNEFESLVKSFIESDRNQNNTVE